MTKAFSLVFDGDIVRAVVPRELAQEIIRVQSEEDTDFPTACKLVAERANVGSAKYRKAVKAESERTYRSRHFKEMNKSLLTKYEEGVEHGKEYAKIRSECSNHCGNDLVWDLTDDTDRKEIYGILQKGGIANWSHKTC